MALSEYRHAALLLVEDNPDVRVALADMLQADGHTVTVADSADAALALLAEDAQAAQTAVLSDVDLDGPTNGVTLMQRVAELHPALPRLLMSGLPPEILAARFGLAEGQPLLSKPFTITQFDEALRQALSLAGARQA